MRKIIIIDDEPLVQVGIRSMIHWDDLDVEVCGVAANGQLGFELIEKEHPDIVITDIKMPVMSGLELLKKVRDTYGNFYPAFIILTSYEDFQMAKQAISYQVIDYLVKIELTADRLKESVQKAIAYLEEHATPSEGASALKQSDIQILKDKFFIRLLHNLYDSREQFELLRKELDIPFSYPAFQCCYFEMVNAVTDTMPLEKQVDLFSNSYALLKEICSKYMNAYFLTLDRKHGVIIRLYEEMPAATDSATLKQYLQQISDSLYSYYRTQLKCGVGTVVTAPFSISESYQSAREVFGNLSEESMILALEDINTADQKNKVFNISILKDDLNRALTEYDAGLLHTTLSQMTSLFQEYASQYVQTLDAACNVLFLSISLLPNGEELISSLYADVKDGYRSIYNQKNTAQVIAWLEDYRDRLCQVFMEQKREHRHHIVDNVKKYIEAHIDNRLSLNEVSAIYGISPNYLSSLFKKYNDCGYTEYVTEQKIKEARKLMLDGNKKVYEIADALGFESAFYFSKVFKKVEGISPTEFINRTMDGMHIER